jgi:hypothetical protein
VPTSDVADNPVGIDNPFEGFRFGFKFDDEAMDCRASRRPIGRHRVSIASCVECSEQRGGTIRLRSWVIVPARPGFTGRT